MFLIVLNFVLCVFAVLRRVELLRSKRQQSAATRPPAPISHSSGKRASIDRLKKLARNKDLARIRSNPTKPMLKHTHTTHTLALRGAFCTIIFYCTETRTNGNGTNTSLRRNSRVVAIKPTTIVCILRVRVCICNAAATNLNATETLK